MALPALARMGAPLTLTRELADQMASDVEAGEPLEAAAGKRGIPTSTVYRWLLVARDEDAQWEPGQPLNPDTQSHCAYFLERVQIARAALEARLARDGLLAVGEGTKENQIRSKAALDYLGRHPSTRKRWGQQLQVSHSGTLQHQHALDTAPLEDLQALAGWDDTPQLPEPPSA